ncbi:uncharacterized protein DUF982 [Rhizobium azibense]|nr:uncharacterized protein DUF982 [Rhizobium azibense]
MPEDRQIRRVRAAVLGLGKYRSHSSLRDIAETLLNRWPEEFVGGEASVNARLICIQCFEGRPAEDARDAFILALDEAGISVMLEDRMPRYPVPSMPEATSESKAPKRRSRSPSA